jgi:hypothetical protein
MKFFSLLLQNFRAAGLRGQSRLACPCGELLHRFHDVKKAWEDGRVFALAFCASAQSASSCIRSVKVLANIILAKF